MQGHKLENHKCGLTGCTAKLGKICTHVIPKCANCGRNHQATIFKCPARLKAQTDAWKEKVKKSQAKNKQPASKGAVEEESAVRHNGMEVDIKASSLANGLGGQSSELSSLEDSAPEHNITANKVIKVQ